MKKEFNTQEEMAAFAQPLMDEGKYIVRGYRHPTKGFFLHWIEHKDYIAHDGKAYPDEVWTNIEGEIMLIQDMDAEYARNALRRLLRNRREAQEVLQQLTQQVMQEVQEDEADEQTMPVSESVGHTLH